MSVPKHIFLLWLQGWENCTWLNRQIAESWEINNPEWKIHYVDFENLKTYVNDIDYIYEPTKNITFQAKSDIIRLSLLKNHGGVWADATMLCMQPLDSWIEDRAKPSDFWMYHGNGAGMHVTVGPASWFIISKPYGYIINRWKKQCDKYWTLHDSADSYFWMDNLFKKLYETDSLFQEMWSNVSYINCEEDGQSHTLLTHKMFNNTPHIKQLFLNKPPYALKLWKDWNHIFPDIHTDACQNSNGYYAIQLSKHVI